MVQAFDLVQVYVGNHENQNAKISYYPWSKSALAVHKIDDGVTNPKHDYSQNYENNTCQTSPIITFLESPLRSTHKLEHYDILDKVKEYQYDKYLLIYKWLLDVDLAAEFPIPGLPLCDLNDLKIKFSF